MFNPSKALNVVKSAFRKASRAFAPLFQARGEDRPTLHELRLDADEYEVKKALGHSFFTGHITPNTRAARIASLTGEEYLLARERGWLK